MTFLSPCLRASSLSIYSPLNSIPGAAVHERPWEDGTTAVSLSKDGRHMTRGRGRETRPDPLACLAWEDIIGLCIVIHFGISFVRLLLVFFVGEILRRRRC